MFPQSISNQFLHNPPMTLHVALPWLYALCEEKITVYDAVKWKIMLLFDLIFQFNFFQHAQREEQWMQYYGILRTLLRNFPFSIVSPRQT